MLFTNKSLLAVLAQAMIVLAQGNSFNVPTGGYNATAGQSLDLSWSPTTSGTVSLILRSGASNDLIAGTYIAQSIENSGSYTWSLPSDITRGSDYAVEIVDDGNSTNVNYTPYFVIDSTNTVASSTSDIALGATATSSSASGSSTGSSASASSSSASASSSSASSSASGSSSSAASSASSSASTASRSASSSASSASRSASSSASAASSSASATATSSLNSGAVATVMPAVLGAFALAAYAL